MKCYIATYYKYDNYGTRLQNFALCHVLREYQIEPVTIYINQSKITFKRNLINKISYLLSYFPAISTKQKVWLNDRKKHQAFNQFNKTLNLQYISYDRLDEIDFNNAFAIAGSDQIWSPTHLKQNEKDIKLFFLQFVPEEKRFAYAPSFGVDIIPQELVELYKTNLINFNSLSIREEIGKNIIRDLLGKDIPVIPDPVFLLTKIQWRNCLGYNLHDQPSQKYILTYFLGIPNNKIKRSIEEHARKYDLEIINITGNYYIKNDIIPSPDKFIELIDKADIVFTDSFHASAFSVIMEKPFFVFKRNDVKQFSRIETLLKNYNCEICKLEEDFTNIDIKLNRMKLDNTDKLLQEQRRGLEYLNKILNICNIKEKK
ncbi:MAG: polysaccharide pyruvyl transferase family protein [Beduini sp.]|uniref:polysaccharide pyruvyl transferase family protein n=1 Tax=Beduini sp. TaxID=1922300 RepID=UPI00399FFFB1